MNEIHSDVYNKLFKVLKLLISIEKEINAENIFLSSKDMQILCQYIDLCNQIDRSDR